MLSNLRVVWTNIYSVYVLQKRYPFPKIPLDSMSVSELEHYTCHAYALGSRWLSGHPMPCRAAFIDATSNTSVCEIRFVPGHAGHWILIVSKGVWDVITIWDVSGDPRKCCEWSPRGAIFNGFCLNTHPSSVATLAVSVLKNGEHTVDILSVDVDTNSTYHLRTLKTIRSNFRAIKLEGDSLAISDDVARTVVWNWRTDTSAVLEHPEDNMGVWEHNKCIHIVFAHRSVLVVRARSIHLFPEPILCDSPKVYQSVARHSFGWIDGVSVTATYSDPMSPFQPLSILVRGESDDPWSSGLHSLDLYTLRPNPSYRPPTPDVEVEPEPEPDIASLQKPQSIPYIFPPTLKTQVRAIRGSLRCRDVILGPCGTAVWIQPQDRAVVGLLSSDELPLQAIRSVSGHESLVAATFPGPLAPPSTTANSNPALATVTRSRTLFTNHFNNWTSLDYDEELGRIALGSSFGRVMILEL